MSKLTLTNITSGYGTTTAFNANNNAITTALENTLSRDGTSPNQMTADLDMNGYRVINVLAQSGDGFIWFGPWVSGTVYSLNNIVSNSGSSYICKVTHTAGANFATDLAAVKWQIISAKGDSGAGTGDMLIANNLSELTATKVTARGNISAAESGANTDITSLSAPSLGAATATTQAPGDNTTKVATTAFVTGSIVVATAAEVLTGTNNTKIVTPLAAQAFRSVLGTPQATTSGTAKGYTGLPSWVKKITMTFSGVSTNGTSPVLVQIGPASGYANTGYSSTASYTLAGGYTGVAFTTGFAITPIQAAADSNSGAITLFLVDSSTNTWAVFGGVIAGNGTGTTTTAGSKSLAGVLDRIQLTTVNGTDAFDAGKINILYE